MLDDDRRREILLPSWLAALEAVSVTEETREEVAVHQPPHPPPHPPSSPLLASATGCCCSLCICAAGGGGDASCVTCCSTLGVSCSSSSALPASSAAVASPPPPTAACCSSCCSSFFSISTSPLASALIWILLMLFGLAPTKCVFRKIETFSQILFYVGIEASFICWVRLGSVSGEERRSRPKARPGEKERRRPGRAAGRRQWSRSCPGSAGGCG